MDMNQYLQIFIEESNDNLQNLNEHLLKLEHEPEDIQTLNEIFRVAHTLKGMAGTMGFVRMQQLTHQIENVLSEIRNGVITINAKMLDILFQCLDALENYVGEITNTSLEGEESYPDLVQALQEIVDGALKQGDQTEEVVAEPTVATDEVVEEVVTRTFDESEQIIIGEAIKEGLHVYNVAITVSSSCVLKSVRAFILFRELEGFSEIIGTVPPAQDIEEEKFDEGFLVTLITEQDAEFVQAAVKGVPEIEAVTVTPVVIKPEEPVAPPVTEVKEAVAKPVAAAPTAPATAPTGEAGEAKKPQLASKSVRVNIERLDTLMNLVSELIIVKTQLEGIKQNDNESVSNYNDSIEYLERVTSSLHDAVMKVRMVPIETVFNRFPRMIRDVSRKLNKDIDLVISGEETELDRTVIDELGDPLIHLLRNAADHGLETTEERASIGKDPKGTIRLQAYQEGNSVVIEVSDDGKGIDVEKIKQKSIDKGVITKEESTNLSDKEILELLFSPGFSTAEVTTDLSGRGVGLDVVKSKIITLGGNVEILTEKGKGSTFVVRLPLTLAIIQALMVKISDEKYAIPLGNIQNIESISESDIKYIQKQEVIVLREEVIPIIRLHQVLDLPTEDKDVMMVVIVKKGEKQTGFVIDALIGQQEIVIKPLGKYLSHINMIAGATILGNGEVALILDINTLV